MLTALMGAALVASAAIKVASAGLGGAGIDENLLAALSEKVAHELALEPDVSVITRQDVAALLGVERQRQLLRCAGESSPCVTELAGALGAALVLSGDIARVKERYTCRLKLLDASTGRAVYSGLGDARTEDELLLVMKLLANAARRSLSRAAPVHWQPVIPLVAGLALAAGGAGLLFSANQHVSAIGGLDPAQPSALVEGARLRDEGKLFASLGTGLLVAGGVALVVAVVWWLWRAP